MRAGGRGGGGGKCVRAGRRSAHRARGPEETAKVASKSSHPRGGGLCWQVRLLGVWETHLSRRRICFVDTFIPQTPLSGRHICPADAIPQTPPSRARGARASRRPTQAAAVSGVECRAYGRRHRRRRRRPGRLGVPRSRTKGACRGPFPPASLDLSEPWPGVECLDVLIQTAPTGACRGPSPSLDLNETALALGRWGGGGWSGVECLDVLIRKQRRPKGACRGPFPSLDMSETALALGRW